MPFVRGNNQIVGLDQLTPEVIQQILALDEQGGQSDILNQQYKQGALMRNQSSPTGRTVGPDRLYVAPSPTEVIGNLLTKYLGMKQMEETGNAQKDLLSQQTSGHQQFFNAWLKMLRDQMNGGQSGGGDSGGGETGTPSGGDY
jgi:hypothetical protein